MFCFFKRIRTDSHGFETDSHGFETDSHGFENGFETDLKMKHEVLDCSFEMLEPGGGGGAGGVLTVIV